MSLETVLAGHENWVYGVHWHPSYIKGGTVFTRISVGLILAMLLYYISYAKFFCEVSGIFETFLLALAKNRYSFGNVYEKHFEFPLYMTRAP